MNQDIDKYDEWTPRGFHTYLRGDHESWRGRGEHRAHVRGGWGFYVGGGWGYFSYFVELRSGLAVICARIEPEDLQKVEECFVHLAESFEDARVEEWGARPEWGDKVRQQAAKRAASALRARCLEIKEARLAEGPQVSIHVEGVFSLAPSQVWPDGGVPEEPTAEDVLELLKAEGDILSALREWNLKPDVTVSLDPANGESKTWWS